MTTKTTDGARRFRLCLSRDAPPRLPTVVMPGVIDDIDDVNMHTPLSATMSDRDSVEDALSLLKTSLLSNRSSGSRGVVTPFDARRAVKTAGLGLPFEEVTRLMRDARDDEGDGDGDGAQRGVVVNAFVGGLRASLFATTPRSKAVTPLQMDRKRDPLRELAKELLPEWNGGGGENVSARAIRSPVSASYAQRAGDRVEDGRAKFDDKKMRELESTLLEVTREAKEEAAAFQATLRMKTETIASLQSELERAHAEARSLKFDRDEFERRLRESETKEADTRESMREYISALHHEQQGREAVRRELARTSERLHRVEIALEQSTSQELNMDLKLKSLRNGDLLSALRDRVVESRRELENERKAHDLSRRNAQKHLIAKDRFLMRARDRMRALGMQVELLEVDSSSSDES